MMCITVCSPADPTINKILLLSKLLKTVLLSRHFFGRLRKSEVPEPTPAPTRLGRLGLQAKKAAPDGSGVPYTKICHFELLKGFSFMFTWKV